MHPRLSPSTLITLSLAGLLAACGSAPKLPAPIATAPSHTPVFTEPSPATPPISSNKWLALKEKNYADDAVIAALGLIDSGYKFGGRNPDAGLDCSGMVSYVYEKVAGLKLPHNAAQMAKLTRPVHKQQLRPGDLVFFDTSNRPYSHVGLYIGQGRFVHAPSSRGKVQISSLDKGWFASRFQAGHTLISD